MRKKAVQRASGNDGNPSLITNTLIVLTVRFFIMCISAINNRIKKLNLNFKIIVAVKRI